MGFDSTSRGAGPNTRLQRSVVGESTPDDLSLEEWKDRALRAEAAIQGLSVATAAAKERLHWMREIGETLARRRDPQDTIDFLLDRAVRMVDGQRGALYVLQSDGDTLTARLEIDGRAQDVSVAIGEGMVGACAGSCRPLNVKEASRDPRWRFASHELAILHTGAVICVPLIDSNGAMLGVLQVINKVTGPYFTMEDEEMLLSIATSVSLLLENFRYYFEQLNSNMALMEAHDRLQERVSQLNALAELQLKLATANERHEEVALVAQTTLELLNADAVVLTYIDETEPVSYLLSANDADGVREIKRSGTLFSYVLESGQTVVVHANDPHWGPLKLAPALLLRSYVSVPLKAKDQLLGLVEVGVSLRRDRAFDEDAVQLLSLVAGQFARSLVLLRDRVRREREDRVSALGTMLGGVLHDLKTPLTISSGYLQLLERTDDQDRRAFYVDTIKRQFEDIRAMTGEVVAYARGEMSLYERNVHLSLLAEELKRSLEQEFASGRSRVEVHMEARGTIRVDEGKLKRIVFNLARNANEAMSEKPGAFIVVISRSGERLRVLCEDTGPGIPTHLLRRVFEPFVSSRTGARSGLGLSIVHRLAEELGGGIEVHSKIGHGSSFSIEIPWKEPLADDQAEEQHSSAT